MSPSGCFKGLDVQADEREGVEWWCQFGIGILNDFGEGPLDLVRARVVGAVTKVVGGLVNGDRVGMDPSVVYMVDGGLTTQVHRAWGMPGRGSGSRLVFQV